MLSMYGSEHKMAPWLKHFPYNQRGNTWVHHEGWQQETTALIKLSGERQTLWAGRYTITSIHPNESPDRIATLFFVFTQGQTVKNIICFVPLNVQIASTLTSCTVSHHNLENPYKSFSCEWRWLVRGHTCRCEPQAGLARWVVGNEGYWGRGQR